MNGFSGRGHRMSAVVPPEGDVVEEDADDRIVAYRNTSQRAQHGDIDKL